VHAALELLGHHGEPELVRIHLAEELSKETVFPCDTQKMYYFVREANAADTSGQFEGHQQGFCYHLEFLSELIDGRVCIDGLHSIDIGLGDSFQVNCGKEHVLKGIKFIV